MPAEFRPIRPDDVRSLRERLGASADVTCDLAPAALRIWRDCEPPHVADVDGALVIRLDAHHEAPYVLEPLGGRDPVAALASVIAGGLRASRVRESVALALPADRFAVVPVRDRFDYVYETAALAAVRGRRHDGLRNRIRKFEREHPGWELRPLARADAAAALALFDTWNAEREPDAPGGDPSLPPDGCQRRAVERAFEEFDEIGLAGAVLVVGGEPSALLAASQAGASAVVHFLFASRAHPGATQAMLVGACRTALARFATVNLEEDLGLPGLRRTKESWGPARLLAKYDVTLR